MLLTVEQKISFSYKFLKPDDSLCVSVVGLFFPLFPDFLRTSEIIVWVLCQSGSHQRSRTSRFTYDEQRDCEGWLSKSKICKDAVGKEDCGQAGIYGHRPKCSSQALGWGEPVRREQV